MLKIDVFNLKNDQTPSKKRKELSLRISDVHFQNIPQNTEILTK